MDPLTIAALLVFAGVVGVYGSVIGAGGGFVLIPGLVLFFDLEGVEAVGTGAVALAAIGIGGARTYDQKGLVDRRGACWFAVGAIPSALFFAAVVADRIDRAVFVDLLGLLLLALAVFVVVMPTTFEEQGEPD
ncbi:MAG: TSUP family transporter, partial [Acidimicrobiales bacterium]